MSTEETTSDGKVKKKRYCNKQFKKNLVKALKLNFGEPDNIDKLRGNRCLGKYPPEKIIEYINLVSKDAQKHIEQTITEPEVINIMELANLMSVICDEKPQELPLMLKLKSESNDIPNFANTDFVNFSELNKFLYTAVNGLPDYTTLSGKSKKVLYDTHQMLMEQVEHDATPEFLEELKSKICAGHEQMSHPKIEKLSKIFQDTSLNPMNFPFEYLLNGTLPKDEESEAQSSALSASCSQTEFEPTSFTIQIESGETVDAEDSVIIDPSATAVKQSTQKKSPIT